MADGSNENVILKVVISPIYSYHQPCISTSREKFKTTWNVWLIYEFQKLKPQCQKWRFWQALIWLVSKINGEGDRCGKSE